MGNWNFFDLTDLTDLTENEDRKVHHPGIQ